MAEESHRKVVEALKHKEASRKNLPSAEHETVMTDIDRSPIQVAYERRNRDLDPQLVWRGKDTQDWSDLVVQAPPLFIQERIHPKVLIDDLLRRSKENKTDPSGTVEGVQTDLFADFNGLPAKIDRTEFYQHDANWSNRMILGDSLLVMASLAEREGLRGKVQCIYIDPPYGIRFNSNFQWSTTTRDVRDGKSEHISRDPEQVKAFRDTWRDGIHSYLTYLRDRLTAARDLLTESGSVFVQIGDENVHRVRALMDELFGPTNHINTIAFAKTSSATSSFIPSVFDYVLWFAKDRNKVKFRTLKRTKSHETQGAGEYMYKRDEKGRITRLQQSDLTNKEMTKHCLRIDNLTSQSGGETTRFAYKFHGQRFRPGSGGWKTNFEGMKRLDRAERLYVRSTSMNYVRFLRDYPALPLSNVWDDTAIAGWSEFKVYVVQTARRVVERCILMTTDPSDLVLDPTCGAGTTAFVAEQWGRRWITIDTSRVALALARARIMGARYAYYLLADSPEGLRKQAEITGRAPYDSATRGDIRQGFVYERVPHITLRSIAKNAEIDLVWEKYQAVLDPIRQRLNQVLIEEWEEWEVPRYESPEWPKRAKVLHAEWWARRIDRQKQIDSCIAANADFEYLYDKPYEDRSKVRVAGPFSVESISPHRALGGDADDAVFTGVAESSRSYEGAKDFAHIALEHLRVAGVQQPKKSDKLVFSSLEPWPGDSVCAEGSYVEANQNGGSEKRAGVFVGPEFGTVSRADLVAAAREAAESGFDVLVACAFNYDARSSEFNRLGRIPVLKARINADLHMADDLKNTGKGNLFVIFGEPDIEIIPACESDSSLDQIQVRINGVDVFDPNTGQIRSDGASGIACWFIDTDYNEESFFVRHAYFLGARDPYSSLKTTLKAEIDESAWSSLNSDTSRPFKRPSSRRIGVKVINHFGDEVMKVLRV